MHQLLVDKVAVFDEFCALKKSDGIRAKEEDQMMVINPRVLFLWDSGAAPMMHPQGLGRILTVPWPVRRLGI